jgi:hypothetical protein
MQLGKSSLGRHMMQQKALQGQLLLQLVLVLLLLLVLLLDMWHRKGLQLVLQRCLQLKLLFTSNRQPYRSSSSSSRRRSS